MFWILFSDVQKIAVIKFHVLLIDQPLDTFCVSRIVEDRKSEI